MEKPLLDARFLAAGFLLLPLARGEGQEPTLEERLRAAEERIRRLEQELAGRRPESAPAAKSPLEAELEKLLAGTPAPSGPTGGAPSAQTGPGATILNPKISFDILMDGAIHSRADPGLFGDHDPQERGFSIPNAELTLENPVDPYFDAVVHAVLSVREGETNLELEEAYARTRSLPANLQLLAGEFFTRFGRINAVHPHAWEFTTAPLFVPRFFGPDGSRNPGFQLSWIAPTPFFLDALVSVQQADGENAVSFLGEPGGSVGGHTLVATDTQGLRDLLASVRVSSSTDLSPTTTALAGVSGMFGDNASGDHQRTQVYGADFYLHWKPIEARKGFPFVGWQTEAAWRNYDAAADGTTGAPDERLHDWGGYSHVAWGFTDRWTLGVRGEYANGEGGLQRTDDPIRDRRARGSLALTYYPTEFSKLRFEYGLDRASHLDDALVSSFVVQMEFLMGQHGAHNF
ncbi:MAG TPA: hypothetical protein VFI25_13205 [Planctomycetota bacterium]|jgi:hypothetical protein|nr:hypothetical protein [Planctomycetota bacterium]